jgi:phosphoglycerol transferase MdoB-like AlkP superfamily enzyme
MIYKKLKNILEKNRMSYVFLFYFFCLVENFLIRLVLTFREFPGLSSPIIDLPKIFLFGMFNDTLSFGYVAIPMVLYLIVAPEKFYHSKKQVILSHVVAFLVIALYSFNAHAEWFFWNEFSSRFNFIAVDYLIYTKEVLGNIKESYPMNVVYTSVFSIAIILYAVFFKLINKINLHMHDRRFSHRVKSGVLVLLFPLLSFFILENFFRSVSENQLVNELSYNGIYQLFHAFRHNELDYDSFYKTLDKNKVWSYMQKELNVPNAKGVNKNSTPYYRKITETGAEKHYNVIFVGVESLAGSFLKTFGNTQNITPYLDELISKSMFFTNVYATGTRTIRGLEALTLSLPPTPGFSIVKRPNNENLFSIGKVFKERGYDTKFIYGGYGYFDNMNYFFSNNNFDVIDRTNFTRDEYLIANIWGVDDESLFNRAIKEADLSYKNKKSFFSFIMTTSNHRPYTYPEGRIDIPSHTSREGAVKYTDYAIHKLLKDSESKPWFHNTIFVIVADHGVGGRGTAQIPMDQFHIPFFIYSPLHIKPQIIDRLSSQIDVAPTLLSLLNFSYDSKFFGKNILKMTKDEERALLGTYSSLGFYSKGTLVTLGPNRVTEFNSYDPVSMKVSKSTGNHQEILDEAISYYQHASYIWKSGMYKGEIEEDKENNGAK